MPFPEALKKDLDGRGRGLVGKKQGQREILNRGITPQSIISVQFLDLVRNISFCNNYSRTLGRWPTLQLQSLQATMNHPLFVTYQIGHLVEETQIVSSAVKLPFYYKFLRTITFRWLANILWKEVYCWVAMWGQVLFSPNKALKILPFKYTPWLMGIITAAWQIFFKTKKFHGGKSNQK